MAEDKSAPTVESTIGRRSRSGHAGERELENNRSFKHRPKGRRHLVGSLLDIGEAVFRARSAMFAEVLDVIAESARSISEDDEDRDHAREAFRAGPEEDDKRKRRPRRAAADTLADGLAEIADRVDDATEQFRHKE